jgi:DNA-binding MarR family transcriptional regulator
MEEGKGVSEYARKVNIPAAVMTRNLLDIGDRNRRREEGYGLVTQERDKFDLRKHNAKVTPKGKALLHKVMTALRVAAR